jgi:hypothetical protein
MRQISQCMLGHTSCWSVHSKEPNHYRAASMARQPRDWRRQRFLLFACVDTHLPKAFGCVPYAV